MREHQLTESQLAEQVWPVVQVAPMTEGAVPFFLLVCATDRSERKASETTASAAASAIFMIVPPTPPQYPDLILIAESGNGNPMRHPAPVP
jgi:hypothetical protein